MNFAQKTANTIRRPMDIPPVATLETREQHSACDQPSVLDAPECCDGFRVATKVPADLIDGQSVIAEKPIERAVWQIVALRRSVDLGEGRPSLDDALKVFRHIRIVVKELAGNAVFAEVEMYQFLSDHLTRNRDDQFESVRLVPSNSFQSVSVPERTADLDGAYGRPVRPDASGEVDLPNSHAAFPSGVAVGINASMSFLAGPDGFVLPVSQLDTVPWSTPKRAAKANWVSPRRSRSAFTSISIIMDRYYGKLIIQCQ